MKRKRAAWIALRRNGICRFGGIVRAKGVVPIEGQLYRFDVADSRYAITGAETGQKCQVVFIGKDLKRQQLRRYFFEKIKMRKR